MEAEVIDTFLTELEQFQTKSGPFQPRHMWIIAENSKTLAHEWHHKYSFPFTKIMDKFACYVTSKPTGIGGAERHWKAVKRNKKGKRGNLSTDKAKKLSCIQQPTVMRGLHCEERNLRRLENCGRMMTLRIITTFVHNSFWRFQ